MYGEGFTWRSTRVNVERVCVQFKVVALGEHNLKNVAGDHMILCDVYCTLICAVTHRGSERRQVVVGGGRFDRGVREGLRKGR